MNDMINTEELLNKLKSMKFSGMAEELRKQIEDPNIDLLKFWERMERLINAEWQLRYNKKFQRYLKNAHLKYPGASFDDTLNDPSRGLDIDTIKRLQSLEWISEARNLMITGLTGAGKTYFTNALGVAALKQFRTVYYIKTSMLLKEMEAFEVTNDPVGLLKYMENKNKVDLLILDDFGLMELDVNKCRNLFEILDAREGRRSTIVISQLPVDQWYDLFKESTYADACLDRLLAKAYRLNFQGASMRK